MDSDSLSDNGRLAQSPSETDLEKHLDNILSDLIFLTKIAPVLLLMSYFASLQQYKEIEVLGIKLQLGVAGFGLFCIVLFITLIFTKHIVMLQDIYILSNFSPRLRQKIVYNLWMLNPFSESAGVLGRIFDVGVFGVLVIFSWGFFWTTLKLYEYDLIKSYLITEAVPYMSVVIGLLTLFVTAKLMSDLKENRLTFAAKLILGIASFPIGFVLRSVFW